MTQPAPIDTPARILAISLRLCGTVDLLAVVPFLMPIAWIEAAHQACGLGTFPAAPIAEYLARSTSLMWAMHGLVLLYLASDVRRHAEVIRYVARITILIGLCLPTLSLRAGLPLWWTLTEGPIFTATGIWYLYWLRSMSRNRPRRSGFA